MDRESRRTVTLLFTDMAGSTALGEQLDPEVYRSVMGRYFAVARSAIERHGGMVEKFVGDAVLAVFGLPELHEDDALRAVRAADVLNSEIAALSAQLQRELGIQLSIRTGVNTGSVVVGSPRAGGSFATGDAVNTAARLEQAAQEGEILLGAATYALVRDAVEVEVLTHVDAKGKPGRIPAYRLLRVLDAVHGRRRRDDVPLVGRMQEARALDDALERAATAGHSHLVTVLGPPGIGKSRLIGEFLLRVHERAGVAHGRCVSYGQGISYWPMIQALRHALHLSGTESEEITRHAVEQAVGEAEDSDRVTSVLVPLLGKPGVPDSDQLTGWAVCRVLERLASHRPLVLCIADLHWAEPTLLELLERVRDELDDLPLLLLCEARPELLDQRPDWGAGALNATTFRLEPFSPAEVGTSIDGLLGSDAPEGLSEAVTSWSGGNPLFVEEIVAHLVETGVLARGPDREWAIVGDLGASALPPTVAALLAARLDMLPQDERDVLSRVSVLGLEFTTADAELLADSASDAPDGALLRSLTRRDFIRRVRSPDGSVAWAFKHILVRDAAYSRLAKSVRAELHERFAEGLAASHEAEAGGEQAGFVAHHLEQAARYRRELATRGPRTDALVDRAVEALVVAGDQARDRARFEDHAAYLDRALRLDPATSGVRRRILAGLADHHWDVEKVDQIGEVLDAFESDLDDTADAPERAYLRMMRLYLDIAIGGPVDPTHVESAAQELVSLGRASGETTWVVRGLLVSAVCSEQQGLARDAAATVAEIIRIGTPAQAQAGRRWQRAALLWGDGTFRTMRDLIHREAEISGPSDRLSYDELIADALLAAAQRSPVAGSAIRSAVTRGSELHAAGKITEPTAPDLIEAFMMAGDLDGAIDYAERVNEAYRRSGGFGYASTYTLQQALLMLERGDSVETVAALVDQAESWTSPYDAVSVAFLAACRALLALRSGDHDQATQLAEAAMRPLDHTQEDWIKAHLQRWLSVIPRAVGDSELERRMLLQAQQTYERKEVSSYDVELRRRLAELDRATTGETERR
jgi:class 3 adenylate cyclase